MTQIVQDYKNAVVEIAQALVKIKDHRSFIKDVKEVLKSKGHDVKLLAKHAKVYAEQNYSTVKAEQEEFQEGYEQLGL